MPAPIDFKQTRLKRYALAEETLKAALSHSACSELEPRALQLHALKRATEMLTARARDAQERIDNLRGRLQDRQLEPKVYSSLQQERWMEERLWTAIQDEVATLQSQLEVLAADCSSGSSRPPMSPDERRRVNLARFLLSPSPSPSPLRGPSKRLTVQDAAPRRLRPLSLASKRPSSVDTHSRTAPRPDLSTVVARRLPQKPYLNPIVSVKSSPSLRSVAPSTVSTSDHSSPCTPSTDLSLKTTWLALNDGAEGTAIIYRGNVRPPIPKNSALLKDLDVSMPDYARTLIDEFDSFVTPPNLPFSSPVPATPSTLPSAQPLLPPFEPEPTPSSSISEHSTPSSPKVHRSHSRLQKRPSQRSSLFSISEAISSHISSVSDHIHSSFSPKPSMSSLKQPSQGVVGLETVGEVDVQDGDASLNVLPSQPKTSFATRIKRRVLVRNSK